MTVVFLHRCLFCDVPLSMVAEATLQISLLGWVCWTVDRLEHLSLTWVAQQNVTKIISLTIMNLATHKLELSMGFCSTNRPQEPVKLDVYDLVILWKLNCPNKKKCAIHRHLRNIDWLMACTSCLVCLISTVSGSSKKRRKLKMWC
jgi:hypothetical protein